MSDFKNTSAIRSMDGSLLQQVQGLLDKDPSVSFYADSSGSWLVSTPSGLKGGPDISTGLIPSLLSLVEGANTDKTLPVAPVCGPLPKIIATMTGSFDFFTNSDTQLAREAILQTDYLVILVTGNNGNKGYTNPFSYEFKKDCIETSLSEANVKESSYKVCRFDHIFIDSQEFKEDYTSAVVSCVPGSAEGNLVIHPFIDRTESKQKVSRLLIDLFSSSVLSCRLIVDRDVVRDAFYQAEDVYQETSAEDLRFGVCSAVKAKLEVFRTTSGWQHLSSEYLFYFGKEGFITKRAALLPSPPEKAILVSAKLDPKGGLKFLVQCNAFPRFGKDSLTLSLPEKDYSAGCSQFYDARTLSLESSGFIMEPSHMVGTIEDSSPHDAFPWYREGTSVAVVLHPIDGMYDERSLVPFSEGVGHEYKWKTVEQLLAMEHLFHYDHLSLILQSEVIIDEYLESQQEYSPQLAEPKVLTSPVEDVVPDSFPSSFFEEVEAALCEFKQTEAPLVSPRSLSFKHKASQVLLQWYLLGESLGLKDLRIVDSSGKDLSIEEVFSLKNIKIVDSLGKDLGFKDLSALKKFFQLSWHPEDIQK